MTSKRAAPSAYGSASRPLWSRCTPCWTSNNARSSLTCCVPASWRSERRLPDGNDTINMDIPTRAPAPEAPAGAASEDAGLLDAYSRTVTRVARRVGPATAKIDVRRSPGGPGAPGARDAGSGSGFLFTPDGLIVTNSHVVAGASRIEVTLPGGDAQSARLRGLHPHPDRRVLGL